MKSKKKILALVIAKKKSKGLKNKNIFKIRSKPCIYWTFRAAQKSKYIDLAMLSTDSEKIINIAKKMNFFAPFIRPSRLAGENSRIIDVILHSIKWLKKKKIFNYKYLLLLQATSPLRTAKHIDNAIKYYFKNKRDDKETLISVSKAPEKSFWLMKKKNKHIKFIFNQSNNFKRQNNPDFFLPNGAIYFSKIKYLKKGFFTSKTLFYEMDKKSSVDIDTIEDINKIH